jgi:hypothetical protein
MLVSAPAAGAPVQIELDDATPTTLTDLRAAGLPVPLPPEYNEFALLVEAWRVSGVLTLAREMTLVRRAGAFELVDVLLFLGAFFSSSNRTTSVVKFVEDSSVYALELAGLADRARWFTQSSLSRALAAVSQGQSDLLTRRLLGMTSPLYREWPLFKACGYRDGLGEPWQVLHWDTTADTVRQRALPQSGEHPDGIRLSSELAAPGYPGRKRGDAVFSRSIISDATSSLWLSMSLGSGSGSVTDQMKQSVDDVLDFLGNSAEQLQRTVVVCDGVSGGLPQTRAVLQGGMHVLTRSGDYGILQSPEMTQRLAHGTWLPVEDSLSGPRREAMELCKRTVDGHKIRVIASRFRAKKTANQSQRGAGTTVGEWRYELFYCSLPVTAWAANDLVTLYFGRAAIENRFAAEDREFDLSRVFSFSLPGQQLASALAMTIWNLRVLMGVASVPTTTSPRPSRVRPIIERSADSVSEEAVSMPKIEAELAACTEVHDGGSTSVAQPDTDIVGDTVRPAAVPEGSTESVTSSPSASELIWKTAQQATERWCETHDGWSYREGTLFCPNGRRTSVSLVQRGAHLFVRYRVSKSACKRCPLRSGCTSVDSPKFRKQVEIRLYVSVPTGEPFHAGSLGRSQANGQIAPLTKTERLPLDVISLPDSDEVPALLPDAPTLLPAKLRAMALTLFKAVRLTVLAPPIPDIRIDEGEGPEQDDEDEGLETDEPHIALDPETRQRRRQTIAMRVAANDRPEDHAAAVVLKAPNAYAIRLRRYFDSVRSA